MKTEELKIGDKVGFYKPLIHEIQTGTILGILTDFKGNTTVFVPEFSEKTWLNIDAIKHISTTENQQSKMIYTDKFHEQTIEALSLGDGVIKPFTTIGVVKPLTIMSIDMYLESLYRAIGFENALSVSFISDKTVVATYKANARHTDYSNIMAKCKVVVTQRYGAVQEYEGFCFQSHIGKEYKSEHTHAVILAS